MSINRERATLDRDGRRRSCSWTTDKYGVTAEYLGKDKA